MWSVTLRVGDCVEVHYMARTASAPQTLRKLLHVAATDHSADCAGK